ncbi:DUF6249 domain-containing protein [Caulobacter henricii]|uniref:DUF6249 domain-containing protein n=1 Tax=Caulobacter henricii TaxID=69395 RepID=A0A0P0NYX9_9CAUL|nr:DUF6249 domain-containing protein [Caulobacter henricii]ALL13311.1 hypothetical protein AQ619_08055 [Caulobacter henricii]
MDGVWVPIILFIVIGAIVIVPIWLKSRERLEMQTTLRAAIDKGQPVPSEVIEALTRNVKVAPTSLSDMRAGVIWMAAGIGIAGFSYFGDFGDHDFHQPGIGVACIPLVIGLAFIILSFFNPNKYKRV